MIKKKTSTRKTTRKTNKKIITPAPVTYNDRDISKRKEIFISSKVYNKLIKCNMTFPEEQSTPIVYLLGEDKQGIVRDMIEILDEDGCEEMPNLNTESLTYAYVTLAKRKLIPMGLARVGKYIYESGYWEDAPSGTALFTKGIGYILTINGANAMHAEAYISKIRKKSDKKDGECSAQYTMGDIKLLAVGVTDK
jgi:hypothetical protein